MDPFNYPNALESFENLQWTFCPCTRIELFSAVTDWSLPDKKLKSPKTNKSKASSVLALVGDAGVGKSLFVLELCMRFYVDNIFSRQSRETLAVEQKPGTKRGINLKKSFLKDQAQVVAFYFFNYKSGATDARKCVQSLSRQLQQNIEQFVVTPPDEATLANLGLAQQFRRLLVKPAKAAKARKGKGIPRLVIAIDAIDECSETEEFITLLTTAKLPEWLGFFMTSRELGRQEEVLKECEVTHLRATDDFNIKDILYYITTRLRAFADDPDHPTSELQKLLEKRAQGQFLNLRFLHGMINFNPQSEVTNHTFRITPEELKAAWEQVSPPKNVEAVLQRLHDHLGASVYSRCMSTIAAVNERNLSVPFEVLQHCCGFENDFEKFEKTLVPHTGDLFYIDLENKTMQILAPQVLIIAAKSSFPEHLKFDSKQGHELLNEACSTLEPKQLLYCNKYQFWHMCKVGKFADARKLLTSSLAWLLRAVSHIDLKTEIRDYYLSSQDITEDVRLLLGILRLGAPALEEDSRQLVSQIYGRIDDSNSQHIHQLYTQAKQSKALDVPFWMPVTATLTGAASPLVRIIEGHEGSVSALVCTADGSRIYTGSSDKTIKKWKTEDGSLLATYSKHEWAVTDLALNEKLKAFCSVSSGGEVILWTKGKSKRLKGHTGAVSTVAFSPILKDGVFATAGYDGTVRVWKVNKQKGSKRMSACFNNKEKNAVTSLAFIDTGKGVITGSDDGCVCLWDLTGALIRAFDSAHSERIVSIDLTKENMFISASRNGRVSIRDLNAEAELSDIVTRSEVYDAVFAPDGESIILSGDDTLTIWRKESNENWKASEVFRGHSDQIYKIATAADKIVSASGDSSVRIWSYSEEVNQEYVVDLDNEVVHEDDLSTFDDASSDEDEMDLFLNPNADLRPREVTARVREHTAATKHRDWIHLLAFSWNSNWLASASTDKLVGIWDVASGDSVKFLSSFDEKLTTLAFAPTDHRLVCGAANITIFDTATWDVLIRLDTTVPISHRLLFSKDGKLLRCEDNEQVLADVNLLNGENALSDSTDWFQGTTAILECKGKHVALPPEGSVGFTVDSQANVQRSQSPDSKFMAVTEGSKLHILRLVQP